MVTEVSRFGEIPKPTVKVRMKENGGFVSAGVSLADLFPFALTMSLRLARSMGSEERFFYDGRSPSPAAIANGFRIALARAGAFAGATSPNPPVGCAILDEAGELLACDAHTRSGESHAEGRALRTCHQKGLVHRIHTVVVTLEPCNHFGQTPPCTEAILATPAKMVVIGVADPNPRVAGGGSARLRAAGLKILFLENVNHSIAANLATASARLIAPFAKWARTGRPWLTVKQALDERGLMVPPLGGKTFTSEASLDLAHHLRRRADSIITGSGTILADAPEFTVRRVPDHPGKRRPLAIIDRRRRTPRAYLEAATARGFDPFLAVDVVSAQTRLGELGCLEALVEAGPMLTEHLHVSELWDEWVTIRKSVTVGIPDAVSVRSRRDFSNLGSNRK
jgi:diaminohydroxyphosphoribosylaminopyrimidine deaminase/5-amino-6-(5-phosphoribosylamino)uracil reductase